jgi:hypothetical protein
MIRYNITYRFISIYFSIFFDEIKKLIYKYLMYLITIILIISPMANHAHNATNGKNIIVGPDYGQLAREQTNSAIIDHFVAFLFRSDTKFNCKSVIILLRNFAIILTIKILLEEAKSYLDKFKFTNLDYIRYTYQYFNYAETRYELQHLESSNKWTYETKNISINSLRPFLESKSIYVSQPATYYYPYLSFLVKVIISTNKIIFCVPNVTIMTKHMEELLFEHEEHLMGNRTTMFRITLSPSDLMQSNSMASTYAFETDNYKQLYESLVSILDMDQMLKIRQTPLCIDFDGEPGTGKTTFGSYIAKKGIFDRIIYYNLVGSKSDFKKIIGQMELIIKNGAPKDRPIGSFPERILLMFDEVDKWLTSYIEFKIDGFRNESRVKKESKTNGTSEPAVVESFIKLTTEEENDKRKQFHEEFLDHLYNLCEGQLLSMERSYVIIFNTNNFDSLFENVGKKYIAYRDRFQQYNFKKIRKLDIIKYFTGMRNECIECEVKNADLTYLRKITCFDDSIYDTIPTHLEISYRTLTKILIANCYDIPKTIKFLANEDNQDNSSALELEVIL